jgi:hypothetical protein
MSPHPSAWPAALLAGLLLGCGGASPGSPPAGAPTIRFSSDFESGSIGAVTALGQDGLSWELALRNDNDDAALPATFRTWWYLRADSVPIGQLLHLEFSRLGFRDFFVPVYSYDRQHWQYFSEQEVALVTSGAVASGADRLVVEARFQASPVWIARTFPYTASDLSTFLQTLAGNPAVHLETLGLSPRLQQPIGLLTVKDATVQTPRTTVWIQARTHPGETGPSYLLEGLLGAVLAEDALGRSLRSRYIFRVLPMHNVDGVLLGNYRTNGASTDLESAWAFAAGTAALSASAPLENRLVNQGAMAPALLDAEAPVVLALNLHSSNSSPDSAAFFIPHFGSDPAKYSPAQRSLWGKQLDFIQRVALAYDGCIEQSPAEGGAGFLDSAFPETWWWSQRQDAVNAITLETTYGRAGFDHWVTQADLRALGAAVASAIEALDTPSPAAGAPSPFRLPFKPELYREGR